MLRLARSPRSHRLFPARRGRRRRIAGLPVAVPIARIQQEARRWVSGWTESWRPATLTRVSCATRGLMADANDHRYRHVAMLAELRQQPDRTYLLFTVTIRMTFDVFRLFDQLYDRRRTYCTVLHCNLSK